MGNELDDLKKEVAALRLEIDALKEQERQREMRQLKWGIRALGTVVIVMGGWIWSQIGHIFNYPGGGGE